MALDHEIAQLNVGRSVAPMDDAPMAEFRARLDEINALAERSPGFVWRLQGDNGNATELKYTDDPLFIVNLSVWRSLDDLYAFTYRSEHRTLFARRFEWFERRAGPNVVIWWQPAGAIPDVHDALRRLQLLEAHGPTPEAFTFKQAFPPPNG
jgi:heme-degrading monooxygenase HmoA